MKPGAIPDRMRKQQQRIRARAYVRVYLSQHPCKRCGTTDIRVLQFHHRDPKTKKDGISSLVSRGAAIPMIAAEIGKCDVLCANCHAIHHHEERNGA